MTATQTPLKSSAPKQPREDAIVWTLFYIRGGPHVQTLHFLHETQDMRVAYQRAKRHCEVMNYRFVKVEPFIANLDQLENFLNGTGETPPSAL